MLTNLLTNTASGEILLKIAGLSHDTTSIISDKNRQTIARYY